MDDIKQIKINELPSPTYRWLKMNDTATEIKSGFLPIKADMNVPSGISASIVPYEKSADIATGMGKEYSKLFLEDNTPTKKMSVSGRVGEPVIVESIVSDGGCAGLLDIKVNEKSAATFIMQIKGEGEGTFFGQTKIDIKKGGSLTLVQIQSGTKGDFFNDIGVIQNEGSHFKLVQLFLDGNKTYSGLRTLLLGDLSSFEADIAYRQSGSALLDMNYVADHLGKKTTSRMDVKGVLKESAMKLFRGTIDFKNGAKGAKGDEIEEVLLLDEGVRNRTVPLILCAEEDVEGNHGATIGKISDDELFYMESRGLSKDVIYEMMSKAKIDSVIKLIPDEEIRKGLSDI